MTELKTSLIHQQVRTLSYQLYSVAVELHIAVQGNIIQKESRLSDSHERYDDGDVEGRDHDAT